MNTWLIILGIMVILAIPALTKPQTWPVTIESEFDKALPDPPGGSDIWNDNRVRPPP